MPRYYRLSLAAAALSCTMATPLYAQSVTVSADEIAAMRAQLNAMNARIDQLEGELAETKAANETRDAAIAAQAAAATDAAAKSTAASEKTGVFAEAAKWAANTKVSGRMYYNISSVSADDAAGNSVEKDGGFEFKRFYLGVDHKFDDTFAGNVTMDIARVDNAGKNVGYGFYVKKAYLEAKLAKELKLRLGAADMPWIPYVEGLNGYRHIEKVVTDLDGFGTSSDWGVHAMGDLANGLISYQVSAVDGGGYRDPKLTKTVDLEGRVSLKYNGINAAIGGYTGKLGNDVEGAAPYRTASRFNALLAYSGKVQDIPVTIGGEYFTAKNWKVPVASPENSAEGYSLLASVVPADQWSVFGRYDWVKPFKDTAPTQRSTFYMMGLQYSPAKIVDLALVFKRDDATDGLKIGNLGSGQATRDEIGLYGQFRF
jgi:hypothetical protein